MTLLATPDAVARCRTDAPLPWLGGLRPSEFLRDYWQKKPLLVRNAFPALADLLEPRELLELAETEDVESRLIIEQGKTPYELREGPFHATTWRKLPATGWTALVQAVDHYLPPLADLLDHFAFVPEWRIDDVMVSYAVPGGNVGPHYDLYDVFLVQGPGQRRWQLGERCDEYTPRSPHSQLKILSDMPVHFDETLSCGDFLYVPPHLAHHGVAVSECLTYSVGFRAPALTHLLEHLVDASLQEAEAATLFTDAGRALPAAPLALTADDGIALHRQAMALLLSPERLLPALAPLLSEPKYGDYEPEGETVSRGDLRSFLAEGGDLLRDPASRWLWLEQSGTLWVNGQVMDLPASGSARQLAAMLQGRRLHNHALSQLDDAGLDWLCQLLGSGLLLAVDGLSPA